MSSDVVGARYIVPLRVGLRDQGFRKVATALLLSVSRNAGPVPSWETLVVARGLVPRSLMRVLGATGDSVF